MKNLRTISAIALISLFGLSAGAVNPGFQKAHEQAHKEQLANHKSRIDKSVLNEIVEHEIKAREEAADDRSPEKTALINNILKEAEKHIGKKYVHGTQGPNTFDCSGFSHYVYKQFGYSISPGSRIQYTQGVKVDRKDARKGDLIFFTSRSSGNNVGHVGIICDVNKENGSIKFIHASVKGVRISEVEGYYERRYVGIKRIIE